MKTKLSRMKITKILMDQDCAKCPYDADCTGDKGCAIKLMAAKLLCEDLIYIRAMNRKAQEKKKKPVKRTLPIECTVEKTSTREIRRVSMKGYMPHNMGHILAARLRANLDSRELKDCWICGHNFELAEIPVQIIVDDVGTRFACSVCYEKIKGAKHGGQ